MANDNIVTIVGNLADDPDLRHTATGVPVANVRVAVNHRFFNRESKDWDERLDGFFTCTVWRDYATHVAASLHRGDRVLVSGRLRSRTFEDKDGATRWVTEIEADEVCPSLRFATAALVKPQRDHAGQAPVSGEAVGAAAPEAAAPEAAAVPF